jgi:hypothetical protein
MNFKRLLYTSLGQFFISVLLGLGLATAFRKVCSDKNCIQFKGPIISEVEGKIYKHGNKCYKYVSENAKCDATKKSVHIATPDEMPKPPSMFGNVMNKIGDMGANIGSS